METIDSVKTRMYRHGFGDCFLLRFYSKNKLKFKMLIDCGLKLNDFVEHVPLKDVIEDIRSLTIEGDPKTGPPTLDVLVITHEHFDHVSGFLPDTDFFKGFVFKEIWMAWTENLEDTEAKQLNSYLRLGLAALKTAITKMKVGEKEKKDSYTNLVGGVELLQIRENFESTLASLSDFFGDVSITKKTASGISYKDFYNISYDTLLAIDHIKTKLAGPNTTIRYLEPGALIDEIVSLTGIRIYILGPPRGGKLNKERPSSGTKKEVYFGQSNASIAGFVKGILNLSGYNVGIDDGRPFSNTYYIDENQAKTEPWLEKSYFDPKNHWRKIEDDWLDIAGVLALQMDGDTNNTSLVLAIEFIGSQKVLLFPGDAQVGNWLSWHDHQWKIFNNGVEKNVTATDLLKNTVLYKVGHHASHNATLKELGLELMTHPDLVALVPEKKDQYSGIPYTGLVDRLYGKTRGRVFFSADVDHKPEQVLDKKSATLTQIEWKDLKKNTEIQEVYIEYTVKG